MTSRKEIALVLGMAIVALAGGLMADPPSGPEKVLLAGNLTGVQHLGIPVTDIARSKEFYGRLGFREIMRAELPEGTDSVKVAMMDFHGFVIELYELAGKDLPGIRARGDGHIDHIALDVLDIGKAFAELGAAGFTIVEKEPVYLPFWEKGIKYFNVLGPDGERVEFAERLK